MFIGVPRLGIPSGQQGGANSAPSPPVTGAPGFPAEPTRAPLIAS